MSDMQTDQAIAATWPEAWARANDPKKRNRSKARQKLRQQWRYHNETEAIRRANPDASCASCRNSGVDPSPGIKGRYCALDSDFHGYQMVEDNQLCRRYKGQPQ